MNAKDNHFFTYQDIAKKLVSSYGWQIAKTIDETIKQLDASQRATCLLASILDQLVRQERKDAEASHEFADGCLRGLDLLRGEVPLRFHVLRDSGLSVIASLIVMGVAKEYHAYFVSDLSGLGLEFFKSWHPCDPELAKEIVTWKAKMMQRRRKGRQ